MVKIRNETRTQHYIDLDDGTEVEVMFEPLDGYPPISIEQVGHKLVVGYLSLDDSGHPNPMEDHDCQGNIYLTRERNSIFTNAAEVHRALQLNGEDDPDIDVGFEYEGEHVTLRELAERDFISMEPHTGLQRAEDPDGFDDEHGDTIAEMAADLYPKHWRAIVGPYVVPIAYDSERGCTLIRPTDWDGDPNDLPEGVWVADKDAQENIDAAALPAGVEIRWEGESPLSETNQTHAVVSKDGVDVHDAGQPYSGSWGRAINWACEQYGKPKPEDLSSAATDYAKSVLSELADWCDGNIYGVCVEVFDQVGPGDNDEIGWVRVSDDAVWGHIGEEWAKQALKEEFDSTVKSLKEKS
jgi:hypothetical protein